MSIASAVLAGAGVAIGPVSEAEQAGGLGRGHPPAAGRAGGPGDPVLQTAAVGWVTELDVELAQRISAVAAELRLHTTIGVGQDDRSVQVLEIGSDTLDAAAIRPF
jgi:hypothetical protein